jgi:hypothetical protein
MAPDGGGAVLKLRAEDADDLAVISACLQDALVPVRDLAFDPVDGTFLFVANRFRWENERRAMGGDDAFERTLCGIAFSHVTAVFYSGFRRADDARILPLLAIRSENGAVRLEFSGGASIKLEVSRILCHARDLGEPWPTRWQPRHDVDGPA